MKSKKWSKEEIRILENNYPKLGSDLASNMLKMY